MSVVAFTDSLDIAQQICFRLFHNEVPTQFRLSNVINYRRDCLLFHLLICVRVKLMSLLFLPVSVLSQDESSCSNWTVFFYETTFCVSLCESLPAEVFLCLPSDGLSVSFSLSLSPSLFLSLSVSRSVSRSVSQFVCQSVTMSVCLSVCVSVCLSVCLSVSVSVSLCLCLSLSLSVAPPHPLPCS